MSKSVTFRENHWDKIASLYNTTQGFTGDPLHQFMIDPLLIELMGDYKGQAILDAGCGNGYFLRKLSDDSGARIGIDASDELISKARRNCNDTSIQFQVGNLEEILPFSHDRFDIILSSMVFQYIRDIEKVASEFFRIMKTNGRTIIAVQHPLFQYHFYIQAKLGGDTGPFKQPLPYFNRNIIEQTILSNKSTIKIFNRTIADYIQVFVGQGFVLNDFREPEYSNELLKRVSRYALYTGFPRCMVFSFFKP